jgi:hypothetical protein
LRDPARDVADLLTGPNQEDLLDLDEWRPFLQTYFAGRQTIDPALADRVHLYLALFLALKYGHRSSAGGECGGMGDQRAACQFAPAALSGKSLSPAE